MATTSPPTSVAVLDSAVTWTVSRLQAVESVDLRLPTPCRDWDLGRLLHHLDDGLLALAEAAETGHVSTDPASRRDPDPLLERVVRHAEEARLAWHARVTSAPVAIGDLGLPREDLLLVGALEVAVHGWDVSRAGGERASLPGDLATLLLDVAQEVVTPDQRGRRFAPPLMVPPRSAAGTRLLAHLGRHG